MPAQPTRTRAARSQCATSSYTRGHYVASRAGGGRPRQGPGLRPTPPRYGDFSPFVPPPRPHAWQTAARSAARRLTWSHSKRHREAGGAGSAKGRDDGRRHHCSEKPKVIPFQPCPHHGRPSLAARHVVPHGSTANGIARQGVPAPPRPGTVVGGIAQWKT